MTLPGKWLTLDPGDSTGWAIGKGSTLADAGTAELWDVIHALAIALGVEAPWSGADRALIETFRGTELVVYEDWALYPHKLQSLAWDPCNTARGIGAIEFICQVAGIPYESQGAKIKDASEAAGAADLFLRPLHENRHANDAIRHLIYKALKAGEGVVRA